MPLQRCTVNGKSGWRWGDSGKCYTGKDGKKLAINQGLAITGGALDKEILELNKAIAELVTRVDRLAEEVRKYEEK